MDWATMRPALLAVVQSATGLTDPGACAWKGSKDAVGRRPPVVANLSCSGAGGVGVDEQRGVFDGGTQMKDITISGSRTFSLTVRIETQEQTDSGIASVFADRLRARIRRDSVYSQLSAVGLAVADIVKTQTIDNVIVDGRVLSVAVVEILLNAAENDRDDSAGSGNWINRVTGASQYLTNPDGTDSHKQATFDEDGTA